MAAMVFAFASAAARCAGRATSPRSLPGMDGRDRRRNPGIAPWLALGEPQWRRPLVAGAKDKAKGSLKGAAGEATGARRTEAEGKTGPGQGQGEERRERGEGEREGRARQPQGRRLPLTDRAPATKLQHLGSLLPPA